MLTRQQDPSLSQHSDESLGLGLSDFAVDEDDKDALYDNATEKNQDLHVFAGRDTQLPEAAGRKRHSKRKHSTDKHAREPPAKGPCLNSEDAVRAVPTGTGSTGPANPVLRTEGLSSRSNSRRPKPPRARSQASTELFDVTEHHALHNFEGRDQQATATPQRQSVVIAPPRSAPRGPSGLLGHIRSLGDYILPGVAAWRSVTPPRATAESMETSGRHLRSSSANGLHTSVDAAVGTGTDSGMRTSQQQRLTASKEDSVYAAAPVGGPSTSAGASLHSAPASYQQTSPARLGRTLCLSGRQFHARPGAYSSSLPPQSACVGAVLSLSKLTKEISARGPMEKAPMDHLRQEHLHKQCSTLQPAAARRGPKDITTNSVAACSLSGRHRGVDILKGDSIQARSAGGKCVVSGRTESRDLRQATSAPQAMAINIDSIAACFGHKRTPERLGTPASDDEAAVSRGQVITEARTEKQQQQQRLRCDSASRGRRTPLSGGISTEEVACSADAMSLEELHMAELEAVTAVARVLAGVTIPQHAAVKKLRLLTACASRRQAEAATGERSLPHPAHGAIIGAEGHQGDDAGIRGKPVSGFHRQQQI